MTILTNSDCTLKEQRFDIEQFKVFSSEQLSLIVGKQSSNGYNEDLNNLKWSFQHININELRYATEYYEEPEEGWDKVYLKFIAEDEKAAQYTPECAGRDNWIKNEWINYTDIYPLFVILEDGNYRLLDGYHRLAGAFYYKINSVAIILGEN